MTGHCAPACHCACSAPAVVPMMYSPSLFSSSTSTSRSSRPAVPLLVPKPAGTDDPEGDECSCAFWLGVGLAGLVVAAFILVILVG